MVPWTSSRKGLHLCSDLVPYNMLNEIQLSISSQSFPYLLLLTLKDLHPNKLDSILVFIFISHFGSIANQVKQIPTQTVQ